MPHNPHSSVASLESPALVTCTSLHSLLALHLCLPSIVDGSQLVFAPGGSKPTMAPAPQWTFFFFFYLLGVCMGEEKEFCDKFNQVVCRSWTLVIPPGWWEPLGGSVSPFFHSYPPPPP